MTTQNLRTGAIRDAVQDAIRDAKWDVVVDEILETCNAAPLSMDLSRTQAEAMAFHLDWERAIEQYDISYDEYRQKIEALYAL